MPTGRFSKGYKKKSGSTPGGHRSGSRKEHEGRVPQPGIPSGPRNKGTVEPDGTVVSYEPKKVKAKVPTAGGRGGTVVAGSTVLSHAKPGGMDLGPIIDPIKKAYETLAQTQPGGDIAQKYAKGEVENIANVAKESLKPRPGAIKIPSSKEVQAGLAIGALVTGGEASAGEKALAKAVSNAGNAESAAKIIAKVKGAPKAAARGARAYPAKKVRAIKAAPRTAVKTVKRAPELKTKAGRRSAEKYAAKTALHHPVKTGLPVATTIPTGSLPGDPGKRARAAIEGTASAIFNHPGETLQTTARSLPAAITAPVALGAAGVDSVLKGTPAPLVNTAKEQLKGVEEIAGNTFSGDPKKAEMAARKEGSLAFLTPIPAVTRLHAYRRGRTGARAASGAARRKLASKSEWANRNIRHSPKGVETPVFGFTARRQSRKTAAKKKQRHDNKARVAAAYHSDQITHAMARAPKGSDVALQAVAEYGIRGPKGVDLIRRGHGPGDAQLLQALDYLDAHPEIFKNKAFGTAVAALKAASESAPAALADKGRRARLLPQGDVFAIPHPAARVPFNQRDTFNGAKTWKEAVEKLDGLKSGHHANLRLAKKQLRIAKSGLEQAGKERARWRGRVKRAAEEGKRTPPKGTKALGRAELKRRVANDRYKQAKANLKTVTADGAQMQAMRRQAKASHDRSFRASGAGHYDNRLLDEYAREVEGAVAASPLTPGVYTRHGEASSDHGAGFQNNFPQSAGRKEHMRLGANAAMDNLDRSLEGVVRGVHAARLQAAGKSWTRDIVASERKPFTIAGKTVQVGHGSGMWKRITEPKSKSNPDGGQYDPRFYARFAYREWNRALDDPYMRPEDRSTVLQGLLNDAEMGKQAGSEPWLLLPRETIKEMRAQINPDHHGITNALNVSSRISTRTLLGTNPAWALAQTVAEGVPLILAHPELLAAPGKIYTIERDLYRYRRDHPEEALALQATAGAAPVSGAALRTPGDMQETYTAATWDQGAKGLTRGKSARAALSFAKLRALGEFDVRRQNAYRQLLYAAEADKRFRRFHSSLTGLFDKQAQLSRNFKGKSRQELWNWLNNDPRGRIEQQKLVDYVDNIQGDWTVFTSHERALAPLTLFYPFLRYSLRWTLWTFPKTHPITATVAYTLGQANSNQLEKLLGEQAYKEGLAPTAEKQSLGNPLGYALPIYTNEKGEKAVLPGGSRISPGQSSLTQALASGNPTQVLSSANPLIGAGFTFFSGKEPLSGEKSSLPAGWAAANSLMGMPAPARIPVPESVPVIGHLLGGESLQNKVIRSLSGHPQSAASKLYASYDPNKTLRSTALPGVPLSGGKWAASELLSQQFDKKYSDPLAEGVHSRAFSEAAYGNEKDKRGFIHGEKKPLRVLLKEHGEAKKAGEKISEWEKQFYPAQKKLTKREEERQQKAYELGQGGILIPTESKRQKRKKEEENDPFGTGSASSTKALEEAFGTTGTSTSELEEAFGTK